MADLLRKRFSPSFGNSFATVVERGFELTSRFEDWFKLDEYREFVDEALSGLERDLVDAEQSVLHAICDGYTAIGESSKSQASVAEFAITAAMPQPSSGGPSLIRPSIWEVPFECSEVLDVKTHHLRSLDFVLLTPLGRWLGAKIRALSPSSTMLSPVELATKLLDSPQSQACFVEHWFRYGYGRSEDHEDGCTTRSLTEDFVRDGFDVRELMVRLTTTDTFLHRVRDQDSVTPEREEEGAGE